MNLVVTAKSAHSVIVMMIANTNIVKSVIFDEEVESLDEERKHHNRPGSARIKRMPTGLGDGWTVSGEPKALQRPGGNC